MERKFYLLTYDIADPKRLSRIARAMTAIGERVQDSVFEAWLNAAEMEKLQKKVKKIMKEKEDSLRLYSLCEPCKEKIQWFGIGKVTPAPAAVII